MAVFCSTDLCGSLSWTDHCFGCLFCSIQRPAHPTPHRKWFMVCIWAGSCPQGCHGTFLLCLVFSWGPHQPLMAPVPWLIKWRRGYKSRLKHLARGMLRSCQNYNYLLFQSLHCVKTVTIFVTST